MKKISIALLSIGLLLLGLGSFNFFEEYDAYLIKEDNNTSNEFNGKYINNEDVIIVTAGKSNFLSVSINDETYDFEYNGEYYKNNTLNYLIKFQKDSLLFLEDEEEESILFKKTK